MSEKYHHGVYAQEKKTELTAPVSGTAGMQVIFGTAPVNLSDEPEASVNVPVICSTMQEAISRLGYSEDYASYTLCQSMYACFQVFGVAPVVFVNVLDPKKHKKANDVAECMVRNRQGKVAGVTGILKSSVVVKKEETALEEGKEYLLSFDESGILVITILSEEIADGTTLKVESESIDPSAVTESDIIGGYDVQTGKESGLEVLRQVYPRTGIPAALILAPGWSHIPEVGAVMTAKCESINGAFMAECLLDLDTSSAKLYTDVPKEKEDSGYQDSHAVVLWPKAMAGGKQIYLSAMYGAMAAHLDASNDNVPSLYPSNCLIRVDSAVTEDGTEIYMDREQANTLNGAGVVTLVNEGGWKAWGNNTSAYPAVQDIKDRWIACRRMFTWMSNSLITTYRDRVDSPANFRLIEAICDSENIRLNSYVAAGKLAGGRIEYNEEENRVRNVMDGQVIFRIYMAAYTPAENILFILQFDPALLAESLSGGERS